MTERFRRWLPILVAALLLVGLALCRGTQVQPPAEPTPTLIAPVPTETPLVRQSPVLTPTAQIAGPKPTERAASTPTVASTPTAEPTAIPDVLPLETPAPLPPLPTGGVAPAQVPGGRR